MAAKKGERGRGKTSGDGRSSPSTVSGDSSAVKRTAAQRAAEARLRVKRARAREQRAKAVRDLRQAKVHTEAAARARVVAAVAALATEEAAAAARPPATSDAEARRRQLVLLEKRFEVQLAPRILPTDVVEVKLGRELLEEKIASYYMQLQAKGKIKPLSKKHATGKTWHHESYARSGAVVDRFVGRFLNESTLEYHVRRLLRAAQKASALAPNGELRASFSVIEYGRGIPKSPGPALIQDAFGALYQAYDGTAKLATARDLPGFEAQVRTILETRLRTSGNANAILIDSFEVKSYRERSVAEKNAYRRARRAAKKAKFGDRVTKLATTVETGIHTPFGSLGDG